MDEIKRLTPAQRARCNRLIRRLCANYDGGNCLPLDDGEGCVCVQTISYSLLCKYFRRAVLPADKALCADIYRQRTRTCERCGKPFAPSIILTPRTAMHPGYYNWLFHTTLFADEFYKWGHGIVADLWTTRWQEMKSITVPVPEYAEQERIAAFLDAECAEIDAVLEKTRASIEEYKKLKQAVITQAVTKGIRGDRPMKDSGIEWIGAIQKDWGSNTIAQLCSQVKCKNTRLQEKNLLSLNLRVAVTRAKEHTYILTPNDDPCSLL